MPDNTREEQLLDKVNELLGDDYACNRVWEAWHVGTMTEDDFEPLSDTPRASEIVELIQSEVTKAQEQLLDELQEELQPVSGNTTARNEERASIRAIIEANRKN